MEKAVCCLLLVAMTTARTSGTYYSMPGLGSGYGWGYGIGHPLMGMTGMGIGHKGFHLPLLPMMGVGLHYQRPLSYNLYGGSGGFAGSGYGGYYPRTYGGYGSSNHGGYLGGYGYSNGLYNSGFSGGRSGYDDDGDDFWPYSGIDDWDLNGFG